LIHCFKNRSLIFPTRRRNTPALSASQLVSMHQNPNWCKLKHTQTCLHYRQVAWPPLSGAIKSFQELHRHSMYFGTKFRMPIFNSSRDQRIYKKVIVTEVAYSLKLYYYPTFQGPKLSAVKTSEACTAIMLLLLTVGEYKVQKLGGL